MKSFYNTMNIMLCQYDKICKFVMISSCFFSGGILIRAEGFMPFPDALR